MKIKEIVAVIDSFAPFAEAQKWDNSGFLVGSPEAPVSKAVVTLDITAGAIDYARSVGAELIVSHHPVIFHALSALHPTMPSYQLAQSGIAAIAAHTNLDICDGGVGDCLAAALGLKNIRSCDEPFLKLGDLSQPLSAEEFAAHCAQKLGTPVRLHKGCEPITTVAVGGGSCGEFARVAEAAGAQVLVSGEIRHNHYIDEISMTLVEAGHYATEQPVIEPFAARLRELCPAVEWLPYDIGEPYITIG